MFEGKGPAGTFFLPAEKPNEDDILSGRYFFPFHRNFIQAGNSFPQEMSSGLSVCQAGNLFLSRIISVTLINAINLSRSYIDHRSI
tara:strand:- start:550 stop:807 length:258 start_codon:yes stop_codon:yes gene_type:complete